MRSFQTLAGIVLLIGFCVAPRCGLSGQSLHAVSGGGGTSSQSSDEKLPKDVYPDTGNRLPPVKREELDEMGKKLYDATGRGAFGPGAIRLYSPTVADYEFSLNRFLREKSGLNPRLVELAILVTVREMDSEYPWTVHEPAAQKAGLEQNIIDTVKYRKPLEKLGEKEAVIIQLGREALGEHKVAPDTFARALKLFGNRGLVNLVSLMGSYSSTAIFCNTFDQQVPPGTNSLLPIP